MGRENETKRFTAHIDYDFGYAGTLSIIPSYTDMNNHSAGDTSFTMMENTTEYYTTVDGDGFERGLEMRLASSEDFPFKWIVGVNYYKSEDEQWQVDQNETDPNEETEYTHAWNQQITKAIYANVTYPLTDTLRATVGARQSWDENNSMNWEKPGKGGSSEPTTETFTMEYDDPNFKLGIEYDLAENSMLYADVSSSYRMNGGAGAQKELDPEELTAYSIGAKNRFFDNRFQLNAAAYYYDYKNYFANMDPARTPVDSDGDGVYDGTEEQVNMETGDARIYGFDIQTTTILTDKDKLDLNISYVKKEFTDLFFDFPDIINDCGIEDLNYDGNEMPQAPNWNITANYSHNFVLPNGGTLTPRLEASYTSKYVLNWMAKSLATELDEETGVYSASVSDTSDIRWQEAYVLGNISLVYSSPDGNWTLTGYVKNIEDYAVKQFLSGQGSLSIGSPRTIGVSVSAKF
jgi:iron complex outermembrane receptor protein